MTVLRLESEMRLMTTLIIMETKPSMDLEEAMATIGTPDLVSVEATSILDEDVIVGMDIKETNVLNSMKIIKTMNVTEKSDEKAAVVTTESFSEADTQENKKAKANYYDNSH